MKFPQLPTFAKTAPFADLRPLRTTTLRLSKLFLPLLSLLDRRQRMHPTTALIVDCGSGFTRATVFSRDAHGHVRACEAHEHAGLDEAWRERRVVDALVEGGAALRDWAASIQALIDATGCTRAVVGTTGGLRQAVADGLVTPAMVAALVALLGELAPSATVRILSGEDEARAHPNPSPNASPHPHPYPHPHLSPTPTLCLTLTRRVRSWRRCSTSRTRPCRPVRRAR